MSVPEGTYFVQNRTTEKYLQIDEAVTNTSGAKMEQWEFDGGNDQRWVLTLLSDGYYKIISSETGYVLSLALNENDVERNC